MATKRPTKSVFAARDASEFIGRTAELDLLLAHARGESRSPGLVVLAAPSAGLSELFRQTYDRLFSEQQNTIPFYFEFRESDGTVLAAIRRFLREFLLQVVAFRRRDANVLAVWPGLDEIGQLATPSDGHWIDRLIEAYEAGTQVGGDWSLCRTYLSAPLRAAARGARVFAIIDNLDAADSLAPGSALFESVIEVFARSSEPFVLGGLRRNLYARTPFDTMYLDLLTVDDAGKLIEIASARTGVAVTDQTRDLMAVQLDGNPKRIYSLFAAALDGETPLDTFSNVEAVYTDEIYGGRLARHYDSVLGRAFPDPKAQAQALRLLDETLAAEIPVLPVSYWSKQTASDSESLDQALKALHFEEVVNLTSAAVGIDASDTVFCDYLRGRVRLELERLPRALVVGESAAENVRRAPKLMARFYRQGSALDLADLMQTFDGQQVSPVLIDHRRFRDEFKGADENRVLKAIKEDNEKITLPRVVYTVNTSSFYPRLDEFCDRERSVVGIGFSDAAERAEVVWIAAEIDSKLEASREVAESWCDRLELAALYSGFENYRLWLVAPEGFTDDAIAALAERNAYGSSRRQVVLLGELLNPGTDLRASGERAEYEITIPMGEDAEMIAARAVEDIARRHGFPSKAINQIKTALVEACINASEHSLSPDQRIHQHIVIKDNSIEITVTNRGLRLIDQEADQPGSTEERRGWGLKLMRTLMDDVRVEKTEDGTQVTLIKSINPE